MQGDRRSSHTQPLLRGEDSVRSELSVDAKGAVLTFVDCTYVVRLKKRGPKGEATRRLIDGCSASVPAGEVLALMGPSGAGKTTLLNMLTLERSGGSPSGSITLNGHPFTFGIYRRHACYLPQTSQLWPFLTAREHLELAAALYQPGTSASALRVFIDKLLRETGLEECQETRVGNEFFKGLSGGQKRRLSLAVALCKKPHVVFLDEPTSGLDAAAAASIMHFLKETAARMHIAIICTIHQPSSSVFAGFDSVCFLTGGQLAYLGKAAALPEYLASVGRPLPPNSNPADIMLDLTNRDFSEHSTVEHMLRSWSSRAPAVEVSAASELFEPPERSFCNELRFLLRKHLLLVLRDPMQYTGRAVLNALAVSFFAVIYIKSRQLTQDQVSDSVAPQQRARLT
jgi:ABC-type multidrug transport system ATPase subunit